MNTENRNNSLKDWKLVNFCEFDKYATKSYCAIHNVDESLNLGDITKVDETKLQPFNMICGGSPCQDFSVAGKQKGSVWTCKDCGHEYNPLTVHWSKRDECPNCGSKNIDKTRSSLLVEYLRVIRANKPNFGMYENVKNIVGKQFRDTTFKLFEDELHEYGYNTYWKVLNAKDYGVPQNRERVYLIFIKKELDNGKFVFPKGFDNGIRLRDVLEDEVDEKYYLSQEIQDRFQVTDETFQKSIVGTTKPEFRTIGQRDLVYQKDGIMGALVATDYKQPKQIIEDNNINMVGLLPIKGNEQVRRVYDTNGISPTLNTMQGGDRQPRVLEQNNKLTHSEWKEQMYEQFIEESDGEPSGVTTNRSQTFGYRPPMKGLSKCLRAEANDAGVVENFRVRKLTPNECWKLMGLTEEDCINAKNIGVADSQLYKQAGNGIVTNCVELLAEHLYKAQYDNAYICTDERLSGIKER